MTSVGPYAFFSCVLFFSENQVQRFRKMIQKSNAFKEYDPWLKAGLESPYQNLWKNEKDNQKGTKRKLNVEITKNSGNENKKLKPSPEIQEDN
jgi:hypothetical protein